MTLTPELRCLETGDDGYSLLQWGDPSKPGRMHSVRMPTDVAAGIVAQQAEIDRLRAYRERTEEGLTDLASKFSKRSSDPMEAACKAAIKVLGLWRDPKA